MDGINPNQFTGELNLSIINSDQKHTNDLRNPVQELILVNTQSSSAIWNGRLEHIEPLFPYEYQSWPDQGNRFNVCEITKLVIWSVE